MTSLKAAKNILSKRDGASLTKALEKLDKSELQELADSIKVKNATARLVGSWEEEATVQILNDKHEVICNSANASIRWSGCVEQIYSTEEGLYNCAFLMLHRDDFDSDHFEPGSMALIEYYIPDDSLNHGSSEGDDFSGFENPDYDEDEFCDYQIKEGAERTLYRAYLECEGVTLELADGSHIEFKNLPKKFNSKLAWFLFSALLKSSNISFNANTCEHINLLLEFLEEFFGLTEEKLMGEANQ